MATTIVTPHTDRTDVGPSQEYLIAAGSDLLISAATYPTVFLSIMATHCINLASSE